MLDPTIQELGNNRIIGKKGSMTSRKFVYERKFPMPYREKYTGWEYIEATKLFKHENIQAVQALENVYSGQTLIEYNQLINLLVRPR
jgi:hypothetical protein